MTMDSTGSRARLRDILAGERCVLASSLFDPMSARVADELGFEVGLMGGSVASLAVLGAPDHIVLSLTELCEQVHRVCRAGKLCVLVDADHGYGNALNVMRTVEELEAAGAAGCTIEDTLLPRAYGKSRVELIPLEEGVGKMQAAVRARGDAGLAIFGRTSAASLTGMEDAVRRLQAYEKTGVDALFIPGLKSREELDHLAKHVTLPLIAGGVDEKLADPEYLRSRGVRVWMAGHQAFNAAVQGLYDAMKAIRDGALPSQLKNIASSALMAKLTASAAYDRAIEDYLGG